MGNMHAVPIISQLLTLNLDHFLCITDRARQLGHQNFKCAATNADASIMSPGTPRCCTLLLSKLVPPPLGIPDLETNAKKFTFRAKYEG